MYENVTVKPIIVYNRDMLIRIKKQYLKNICLHVHSGITIQTQKKPNYPMADECIGEM